MLQPALAACVCSGTTQHLGVSLLSVEWSCFPTFSPLLGEAVIDKLKNLHFTIQGLVSVSSQGSGLQGKSPQLRCSLLGLSLQPVWGGDGESS